MQEKDERSDRGQLMASRRGHHHLVPLSSSSVQVVKVIRHSLERTERELQESPPPRADALVEFYYKV